MIRNQAVFFTLSFLLAHNPEKENIKWKDYARLGGVNNTTINQTGIATYYRIKRITDNTFRDFRFFGHFFDLSSDLRIRTKSSNKYDFNPNLYHFTTYVYHKSGENLRYHFNQGMGAIFNNASNGNKTFEIGWAYDKSDYLESDEKTTYIKGAGTLDKDWDKIQTKLEVEYFHQISEQLEFDLSRFQTILELQYHPNKKWGFTIGIVKENYSQSGENNISEDPTNIFLSISRSGFIN
tara:strand:- start:2386 stop:3096 length:711 start_codon:yes stop_codon:yes gene_type:complete